MQRIQPLVAVLIVLCSGSAVAQDDGHLIADWTFVPRYMLGGSAANLHEGREDAERSAPALLDAPTRPILLRGQSPTERMTDLLDAAELPDGPFTVEWWLNHHVDRPVGALITARERDDPRRIAWALVYDDHRFAFGMQDERAGSMRIAEHTARPGTGQHEYWWHAVAVYTGYRIQFYVNGELVQDVEAPASIAGLKHPQFELAAYTANEPYMEWANLVHAVRIHDKALSANDVTARCGVLEERLRTGRLYGGVFHYTAPPYLCYATTRGINVLWETDRPSTAEVRWGKTAELGYSRRFDDAARLHELTIDELEPDTPYFYRVICTDESGQTLDSGLLTFRTAVDKGQPFKFAVIGDTETRPHINHRLAELIWQDRPSFVITVGDLTDGGMQQERWQWTHEYFQGLGALHSRVPVFPVPGNGEGDLYWYRHYHRLPGENGEAYYSFDFGDAQFFMLDSNQRENAFRDGGVQNTWLRDRLGRSEALWKFAAHHHATYTSEEDDYGDRWKAGGTEGDPRVQRLVPVYEQYNVDIVFFGHLHLYERSRPIRAGRHDAEHGVVHLLAGGGGGNLEDFAPTPPDYSDKVYRGHCYLLVSIAGGTLTGKMYDTEGRLRDHFTITKLTPERLSP